MLLCYWNSEAAISKEQLFFVRKNTNVCEMKKSFGLIKTTLSLWLKLNFRMMASSKHVDVAKIENSETSIFKEHLFWTKFLCFWNEKMKGLGQIKPRFSLWWKINFRKTLNYKHVDLRKIENVRSEYYSEDVSKDESKFQRNIQLGKRVIFDNDRKLLILQYHSILP